VKDISNSSNERSLLYWLTAVSATYAGTNLRFELHWSRGRIEYEVSRLTDPTTCAILGESCIIKRVKLAITKSLINQNASKSNKTYTDIRLLAVHSANPPASTRALQRYLISVRLTRLMTFRCAGRPTTRYPLPLSSGPIEASSCVVSSRQVFYSPSFVGRLAHRKASDPVTSNTGFSVFTTWPMLFDQLQATPN